jgi:hypothetical protein
VKAVEAGYLTVKVSTGRRLLLRLDRIVRIDPA